MKLTEHWFVSLLEGQWLRRPCSLEVGVKTVRVVRGMRVGHIPVIKLVAVTVQPARGLAGWLGYQRLLATVQTHLDVGFDSLHQDTLPSTFLLFTDRAKYLAVIKQAIEVAQLALLSRRVVHGLALLEKLEATAEQFFSGRHFITDQALQTWCTETARLWHPKRALSAIENMVSHPVIQGICEVFDVQLRIKQMRERLLEPVHAQQINNLRYQQQNRIQSSLKHDRHFSTSNECERC